MWSIVLRYILKRIRYWVKKNRSVETTAANNEWAEEETGAKNHKKDADEHDRR